MEKQFVVLNLGKEEYGIDIMQVKEIIGHQKITKLPQLPSYIEGIINYRGKAIPVINLKEKFNLGSINIDGNTRIIVTRLIKDDKEIEIGYIVDSAKETLKIDEDNIDKAYEVLPSLNRRYLNGIGKVNDRLIILIDLLAVLSDEQIEEVTQLEENLKKE